MQQMPFTGPLPVIPPFPTGPMKTKDDVMGMNKDDKGMDDDTTTTSTKMTSDERKSLEMLVLPPLPSPTMRARARLRARGASLLTM